MKKLTKKAKIALLSTAGAIIAAGVVAASVACSQVYSSPFNAITTASSYPQHTEANYTIGTSYVVNGSTGNSKKLANNTFSTSATIQWTNSNWQGNTWHQWPWANGGPAEETPPLTYAYFQWFYYTTYNASINSGGTMVQPFNNVYVGATTAQNTSILKCIIGLLNYQLLDNQLLGMSWPTTGQLNSNHGMTPGQAKLLSAYLRNFIYQYYQEHQSLLSEIAPSNLSGANWGHVAGTAGYQAAINDYWKILAAVIANTRPYQQISTPLTLPQIQSALATLQISPVGQGLTPDGKYATFNVSIGNSNNHASSANFSGNLAFNKTSTLPIPLSSFSNPRLSESANVANANTIANQIGSGNLRVNWPKFVTDPVATTKNGQTTYTLTTWQQAELNKAVQTAVAAEYGDTNTPDGVVSQLGGVIPMVSVSLASYANGVAKLNIVFGSGPNAGTSTSSVGTGVIFPTTGAPSGGNVDAILDDLTAILGSTGAGATWPIAGFTPGTLQQEAASTKMTAKAYATAYTSLWGNENNALYRNISTFLSNHPQSPLTKNLEAALGGASLGNFGFNPVVLQGGSGANTYPEYNSGESFGIPGAQAGSGLPEGSGEFQLAYNPQALQPTAVSYGDVELNNLPFTISPGTGFFAQVLNPADNGNNTNNPATLTSPDGKPFLPTSSDTVVNKTGGNAPANPTVSPTMWMSGGNLVSAEYSTNVDTPPTKGNNYTTYNGTINANWHVNPQFMTYIQKSLSNATILRVYCDFYTILANPGQSMDNTAAQNGQIKSLTNPTIPGVAPETPNTVGSNDGFAISELWDVHLHGCYTNYMQASGLNAISGNINELFILPGDQNSPTRKMIH